MKFIAALIVGIFLLVFVYNTVYNEVRSPVMPQDSMSDDASGNTQVFLSPTGQPQAEPIDELEDIHIPDEFTLDLDKGYFIRFDVTPVGKVIVYNSQNGEKSVLLSTNVVYTQESIKISEDDFTPGDIVLLQLLENNSGELETNFITRYPQE